VTDPLLEAADRLYALPQGDFTPARDALVKEHKTDKELAARLKALKKPSVAAWVVNLLVRRESEQVDQLLTVGAALRAAQENLDAAQLRELTKQRRQLTHAVTTRARQLAGEEGTRVTEAVAEQVEATLTAAMVDEGAGNAVRSGLLVAALSATGVDAVDVAKAVAVPEALGFAATPTEAEPPAPPDLHVVPDPEADAKARVAAQTALDEAESALEIAESALEIAESALGDTTARSLEIQAELDELRRRVADLEEQQEAVDEEIADAEETRDGARADVADATRTRDRAADKVASLHASAGASSG